MKLLAILLLLAPGLAAWGELKGFRLPTVSALFSTPREIANVFGRGGWMTEDLGLSFTKITPAELVGWVSVGVLFLFAIWFAYLVFSKSGFTPLTQRRFERFRESKRGYWSLVSIGVLALVSALDFLVVGSKPLAVKYGDEAWIFPAFEVVRFGDEDGSDLRKGSDYGVVGDLADAPVNWRERKQAWRDESHVVVMPLIPYASTGDTITATSKVLEIEDGKLMQGGEPYRGQASKVYDPVAPEKRRLQITVREGVREGAAVGWNEEREQIFVGRFENNQLVEESATWTGEGSLTAFLEGGPEEWRKVSFAPSSPNVLSAPRHLLGTTSQGYDTLAYLFGGLQVNFVATILYVPLVYLIGVTVGLFMGYWGGWFDLAVQRLIEVFSNIPFLYVIMIASASVPALYKDRFGLGIIVAILIVFGWMGMTYYMRTSAMKEKARDYIAASRVIGASTPRILFKHLLPNSIAILVTLIPFSVSGLVLSLTALDYLGFGLPARYASWGNLLRDGLENLTAPWLVTSAFVMLVLLLVLVTFVGEAIREAFDPKRYTYYK